jgi:predicted metal-dependent hydrolase
MNVHLQIGEIDVEVVRKDIKHVHLSVHPPLGRVRMAAPERLSLDALRVFAIAKLPWIRRQRSKLQEQERESTYEYISRESHYVWGRRYLLNVVERDESPTVELDASRLVLSVRPNTTRDRREMIMEEWYRALLHEELPALIAKYEKFFGVVVARYFVQRMKTKWGSCNHRGRTLRFNTELARKPPECLEYIVAHEVAHLVEPTHSERFLALMDRAMPRWRLRQQQLNRLPLRHESWEY